MLDSQLARTVLHFTKKGGKQDYLSFKPLPYKRIQKQVYKDNPSPLARNYIGRKNLPLLKCSNDMCMLSD